MTQYPPLFPSLLAGLGLLGLEPAVGARWLNILLFAGNIFLVDLLIRAYGCSPWISALGSFLMLTSVISLKVHAMAWSEPLFIFLELLTLFLLAKHLDGQGVRFLIASGVAAALAFLTRYVGAALWATGVLVILHFSKETWKERLKCAAVFSLIGLFPTALWITRNIRVAGTVAAREMGFHPITMDQLRSGLDSISSWLLPGADPDARGVSFLVIAALLILVVVLRRGGVRQTPAAAGQEGLAKLPLLLVLYIGVYGLMMLVVISFFDAYMTLDNRYLYPIYVATLVLVLCLAPRFFGSFVRGRLACYFGIACSLVFSGLYLIQGSSMILFSYNYGIGYSSRSWKQSSLLDRVRSLDARISLVSNAPDVVYLLTGRAASMIPSKINPTTRKENEAYPSELDAVRNQLRQQNGVLVFFKTITWRWYLPSEEELKGALGLQVVAEERDGSIYQAKPFP
jgi:hypothetical protein